MQIDFMQQYAILSHPGLNFSLKIFVCDNQLVIYSLNTYVMKFMSISQNQQRITNGFQSSL